MTQDSGHLMPRSRYFPLYSGPGSYFTPFPHPHTPGFLLFPALSWDGLFISLAPYCLYSRRLSKIQVSSNKRSSMITIHIPFLFPQKFPLSTKFPLSPILLPPTPSPYIKPQFKAPGQRCSSRTTSALRGMSGCPTPLLSRICRLSLTTEF